MKVYESIKQMNLRQMAYTFYIFLKPFLGELNEAERQAVYDQIIHGLEQEVGNE